MTELTLKDVSKDLLPFHEYTKGIATQYKKHKLSLVEFVFWYNDHIIKPNGDKFIGSIFKYRGAECVCIYARINHNVFLCEITLKPINVMANIGSGAGVERMITF